MSAARTAEDRRVAPVELTLYQVEAYLAAWDIEEDRDIHIVLARMQNQRATLIAEIPDTACWGACASGFGGCYAAGQGDVPVVIRVTGVGFFDRPHGQTGAAPNNIELHPVLRVEFR